MINLKLTIEQAQAVAYAIQEHIERRAGGDVRHYVDTRYSTADQAFRNYKIGQVQERFNRLDYVLNAIKLQGAEHESD
tara:strand:- start:387 stop:620 length:234 start_codon:yes stop_codon:yes gene_type:complete